LWPGGPDPADGHGGRGFVDLATTGVGAGVGFGVGLAVGRGVGAGVAIGGGGGVAPPPPWTRGEGDGRVAGVGVGPSATIGLLGAGLADGVTVDADGAVDSDAAGWDATGPLGDPDVAGLIEGLSDVVGPDETGLVGWADGPLPTAMPGLGVGVVTSPAVSATVARTRFRRPRATTSRARWAELTTTDGLLPTGSTASISWTGRW